MKNVIRLTYNFAFKTKRRGLTVKAVFYAATARFRIYFYPGGRLHRYLGEKDAETGTEIPCAEHQRDIYFVSDKVARVAKRVPWESKCLVQAMVAQRLLRGYGIGSTLYLGVGRDNGDDGDSKMIAHAWVMSGPYIVCGRSDKEYATVAKFKM